MKATIDWAGERLELHHDRAVFWPARHTLIVADVHFGKASSFRRAGVPVPAGTTTRDTDRLTALIERFAARRLVVLGDFLHAREGRSAETLDVIGAWRARHDDVEMLLVRGNHDEHAGDPPEAFGITCVDAPHDDTPFAYVHDPAEVEAAHAIGGHVHPAVTLRDGARGRMRCACFLFGPRVAIVPAFGSFTGAKSRRPSAGDRVFAIGPGAVVEVT